MKFGKTFKQKQEEKQKLLRSLYGWHKWFAWYPVQLDTERWAWLETVERKLSIYKAPYSDELMEGCLDSEYKEVKDEA